MSTFPDYLYRLSQRDMQVTPLEAYTTRQSGTGATNNTGTGTITVPLGKILVLNSVSVLCQSAGVANIQSAYVQMYIDSSLPIEIASTKFNPLSTADARQSFSTNIIVPEGWTIKGFGKWDAALAGNAIYMMMSGVMMPRGNFAI